ncbi:MAG: hypothetical protein Q7S98_00750 [Deltaproteobacteria bacterium]|nr:hypothetical protein [Deltaproteobacteria bacterium]
MAIAGLSATGLIYQSLLAAGKRSLPAAGTIDTPPDVTARSTYTGPESLSLDDAIEGMLRGDVASLKAVRRHLDAGEIIPTILAEERVVNGSTYSDRDSELAQNLIAKEKKRLLSRFVRPEKITLEQNKRELARMFIAIATNPGLPVPPLANLDELTIADINNLIRLQQVAAAFQRMYRPLQLRSMQPAHLIAFALGRATQDDGGCYPSAVIMMDFAMAIGLPLTLVQPERHVLVSLRLESGERVLFDPTSGTFLPADYYLSAREMTEDGFDVPLDRLLINPVMTQTQDAAIGSMRVINLGTFFPEDPALMVFRAGLRAHAGNNRDANRLIQEALGKNPNHLGILIAAVDAIGTNNPEAALALTNQAKELIAHRLKQRTLVRSSYVMLYQKRIELLDRLERYDEAVSTLNELRELVSTRETESGVSRTQVERDFDQNRSETIQDLALANRWIEAIRLYRNTVAHLSPDNAMVTRSRIAPLMNHADYFDAAVRAWREVITVDPSAARDLYQLLATNAQSGGAEGIYPAVRFAIKFAEAMATELKVVRPRLQADIRRWRALIGEKKPPRGGPKGGGSGGTSGGISYRASAPTKPKGPQGGGDELLSVPARGALLLFDLPEVPVEPVPLESLPPARRPLLLP